jgi:Winged helix DNA-binding domain
MDPEAVVRTRLVSQQLRPPVAASVEDALKNLLAVQAQEYPYARWSLAQRTADATAHDVEQAVTAGRILRTHILRPTWHFVHPADLPWLRALSAPRLHRANAITYSRTGIDAATAAWSTDVLAAAVEGRRQLTRDQLASELEQAGLPAKGLALAYLIMYAEINGVIVSGAPVRSASGALRQTYAAFGERVGPASADPLSREESLAALARRYFRSRGPATVRDCASWSGMTMTDVRRGLAVALEDDPAALEQDEIDDVTFYFTPYSASNGGAGSAGRIDLVQCYDEYIMGYSASRSYLGGKAPTFPRHGDPLHVVLLGGRIAGAWRHRLIRPGSPGQRCELNIRIRQDRRPTGALEQAVARYEAFLGVPTTCLD